MYLIKPTVSVTLKLVHTHTHTHSLFQSINIFCTVVTVYILSRCRRMSPDQISMHEIQFPFSGVGYLFVWEIQNQMRFIIVGNNMITNLQMFSLWNPMSTLRPQHEQTRNQNSPSFVLSGSKSTAVADNDFASISSGD